MVVKTKSDRLLPQIISLPFFFACDRSGLSQGGWEVDSFEKRRENEKDQIFGASESQEPRYRTEERICFGTPMVFLSPNDVEIITIPAHLKTAATRSPTKVPRYLY